MLIDTCGLVHIHIIVSDSVPVERQTGSFIHSCIFRHIEVEQILAFTAEVEYSTSRMAGCSRLRHVFGSDCPAALREIHRLVVVRNLVSRNTQKSGAVVSSVDSYTESKILLADDVGVELNLKTSVADFGSVTQNGCVSGACER